ncbi:hypothetical protein [Mycolicibacterium aurum]|uniref:hypothetical protein n=1 Tax=Mycolicibacterium aurum TaxID=1791 RepID=UPI0012FE9AC0|nr:hypothetical protein [Mycolicibacterium aurum]
MTRKTATVVRLDSHPARQAAERRARDIEEAMRRHPAFQSRLQPPAPHLRLV